MVSVLLCVWCVEWRWYVLLLACTVQWRSPCPAHPGVVLVGTAVVLCAVRCWVRGVWWCVCVCTPLRGGVSFVCPPLAVVVGGAVVDGGVA